MKIVDLIKTLFDNQRDLSSTEQSRFVAWYATLTDCVKENVSDWFDLITMEGLSNRRYDRGMIRFFEKFNRVREWRRWIIDLPFFRLSGLLDDLYHDCISYYRSKCLLLAKMANQRWVFKPTFLSVWLTHCCWLLFLFFAILHKFAIRLPSHDNSKFNLDPQSLT